MNKKLILDFLTDLSNNNSKEWMDRNRSRYLEAKSIWLNEIEMILNRMVVHDEMLRTVQPKNTLNRINNNRKFQPDKPVYKDNFPFTPFLGIYAASYHLSVSPKYSFIGGGLYRPQSDLLAKVRQAIAYDGKRLFDIVTEKRFVDFYGGLDLNEEMLKSAPKGYDKNSEFIELLKMKSFISIKQISETDFLSDNFIDQVEESFLIIKPLIDYLNQALTFDGD